MDTVMKAIKVIQEIAALSLEIIGEAIQVGAKTKVKETVTEKAFSWVATVFRIFT